VAEVLQEWNGRGLHLIYSTEIVPPALRVLREPRATGGIELVIEVLAPHGLTVQQVAPDTWSVVAAAAAERPAPVVPAPVPQEARLLDPVVVTASRYVLAADVPGTHTFLTEEQIESLPKMADEALRAVHRLPGMASNGLSGLAHVRGGEQSETAVLLDGFPLYEPFHLRNFFSPISVLDARIIDSLDVYTGGFGTRYGERMSGVVDARSRRAPADRYGEIGASLFHVNALGAGRFAAGRGEWLGSFRRSHIGEVADLVTTEIGEPEYSDGFGRMSFAFTPGTEATLSFLLARDRIRITEEAETADASYHNRYAWATVEHHRGALRARLIASYTRVSSAREGSVDDPGHRLGSVSDERSYRALGLSRCRPRHAALVARLRRRGALAARDL
jgi:outer membrane receptor protein involved in Fe transport